MSDGVILAFLQNAWGTNATKMQEILNRNPKHREELVRRFLFAGKGVTSQRLQAVFGDLVSTIIWANASPLIGSVSGAKFKPDGVHMVEILKKYRPAMILVFGRVAEEGVKLPAVMVVLQELESVVVVGPHPATRQNNVWVELRRMRGELEVQGSQGQGEDHVSDHRGKEYNPKYSRG